MIFGVFIASVSQILLKQSAQKTGGGSFLSQYLNKYVIIGYLLLFISMLIPFYTYKFVPLKYGSITETTAYVFVMILSAIFLKEKITKKRLIGNLLIICGIIVFSLKIF